MRPLTPAIWYEALATESGVVLQTNDLARARSELMEIRRQLDDPDLDCIDIIPSPVNPSEDLWLMKRKRHEKEGDLPSSKGDIEPTRG